MSADALSGTSGEADPEGTSDAPAFQRDEQRRTPAEPRRLKVPWRRRRDRWGHLTRLATCAVCGRRLWVNWVRAAPCLWCDDSAESQQVKGKDHDERSTGSEPPEQLGGNSAAH